MTVEFRLLGDVDTRLNGQRLDTGHARQRCVLVALLVDVNRPVPVDQLVDRVWADAPPHRARNVLSAYVSRLRSMLTGAEDVRIAREPGGYMVSADPLSVDLYRFRHMVVQARDTADQADAAVLLGRALQLWRGEPFATLDTPWINGVRTALEAERLAVVLDRNDVVLRAGRHAELLLELAAALAHHPLDERLAGQLMLAQYRCGRQADALDTYQQMRRRLVAELGVDPSPPLRELHQQVLDGADATVARASDRTAAERAMAVGLVERDAELATIRTVLNQARAGSGALIVVDGPAGAGKTALLRAAEAYAGEAGLLTLRARGAELEEAFAFGVMRQLFDAVLRGGEVDPAVVFAGAARFVSPLFDIGFADSSAAPSDDPFAARHALFWAVANLASERPLAVLVDDAHWADPASLAALVHIAHRLAGVPAALLIATRSEEAATSLEALRRQAVDNGILLQVPPLGEAAAATLVRSIAPVADDALCAACHTATGGNPFLLQELVRAISDGGVMSAGDVGEQSPERVTRAIATRLTRLPGPARLLAHAAAILGPDVPLREAAALGELDEEHAAAAADALVAAGLARSAHPLGFAHPLVRAAVYAGIGPATRAHEHRRAARMLADDGASAERVAAQLLRVPPAADRWTYERLLAAARLVGANGATDAEATYLRRALQEQPPPQLRLALLLDLARAESTAGEPERAIEHLREALAGELAVDERCSATMLLSGLLAHVGQFEAAPKVLEQLIDEIGDYAELREAAEVALTNVVQLYPAMRAPTAAARERLRRRVETGKATTSAAFSAVAVEMTQAGESAERVAELAERALVGFDGGAISTASEWYRWFALRALVIAGRYDAAMKILDRVSAAARDRGAVLDRGAVFIFRGELFLHTGDLVAAELDARALLELAHGYGWAVGEGYVRAWLGTALVDRGELTEAQRLLEAGPFVGPADGHALLARGRLRLARGRVEDAVEALRESGEVCVARGDVNPAVAPWRSTLSGALLRLGETDEARRLARDELARARAFGAPGPIGIALCAVARTERAAERIGLLREAVQILDRSGAQLARAHALAALGAALRDDCAIEDAQNALHLAVDLAQRCGASVLEDETLAELSATGARPRRRLASGRGALTPSERRIAELVTDGQPDRDIAERLFVTTNAVELHLRSACAKLGIASRAELDVALGPRRRAPVQP